MSPVEVEIVRRKLSVMIENLKALEPIKNMKKDEYIEDIYKRKATERLLHVYDLLEHSMVLDAVRMADQQYPKYINEIENYIFGKTGI